jgi:hypothetical protein
VELGNVVWRVLDIMSQCPSGQDLFFQKIDLSDGFWRMLVEEEARWNFCYVLPTPPGDPIQLVVPSALQMGWAESPGFFASATETIRDNIQTDLLNRVSHLPHPLEKYAMPPPDAKPGDGIYGNFVYVDDFINVAQQDASRTQLLAISRASLHAIHEIFPPPHVTGHVDGKDPVSLKKLHKGDAQWAHKKEILGFMFDGKAKTVFLPDHKSDDLTQELDRVLKKKHLPFKRFRTLLGKLRHVAIILPGLRGLFTPANAILGAEPPTVSLSAAAPLRQTFKDIRSLIRDLRRRPTHAKELVQGADDFLGYCDASAAGAGGVWFSPLLGNPIVWRQQFPPEISGQVVADDNPSGTITNSDLELAAVVLHVAVLAANASIYHRRLGILSDNSATVYWTKRMASRATTPLSAYLLRGLAHLLRSGHAGPTTLAHYEGKTNNMADFASRSFVSHPTASEFSLSFLQSFPSPRPWHHVHPLLQIFLLVRSALLGKPLPLQSWMLQAEPPPGGIGPVSVTSGALIPSSPNYQHTNVLTSSWPLLLPSGKAGTADFVNSILLLQKKRSATFAKNGPWTATSPTLASTTAGSSSL